jgi:dipeptidyl aminopeptidase/acylaminoacyl peptidase
MNLPALLAALALAAAPARHPYTIQDQVALKRLSAFQVSPDGTRVVLAVRATDLEANRGRLDLYLVNADGSGLRALTTHPENDQDPVWAPDGKSVFFLSARGGSSQVWRIAVDGGEATQVTKAPVDLDTFTLSPDGTLLAYSAETFPACDTLECTKQRLDEKAKQKASGRVYDSLLFRHWDAWSDGRRNHLFVQKVAGSPAVDVMKRMDADAPTRPFGDADEYTFAPDGKSVVFTARDVGREEAWSTDLDLFSAPVDGSRAPVKLTTQNRATDTSPRFSPDGHWLAYLKMKRPGFEADQLQVVLREVASGKERVLAEGWDRSAATLSWARNSSAVYVTADDLGQHGAFALEVATGQVRPLWTQGNVHAVADSASGLLVSQDSLAGPADLYRVSADGKALEPLTRLNQEAMAQVELGAFEQFSFPGANKDTVYAYLLKPVGFAPGKKYPLAFLVHGGPQGSFGNEWHYRWNPQVYAAHGYAVVMVDFHGSTGYGQAFTDAISGDWGGKPLEDLQRGLAAAQAKYPFIDPARQCALGASYGGWMVNWIAGVWNEPFKCLVSHDGNLDERFAYFETEELWFPEWEHGGTPWDPKSTYVTHNPLDYVGKWKVPMLVVHGGRDFRIPDTQGMATFTALQRRGIPSRFLSFPDENHWVLKPANSVQWHEQVLGWLDQWTKAR